MKRWSWMGAVALVLAAMLATQGLAEDEAAQGPEIGKPAPEFALKDLDGNEVKLSDLQGKIVVLHFQSMNCPWERGYQPILNRVSEQFAQPAGEDRPQVVFLGINANFNESAEGLKPYHQESRMPYPILKDPGNQVADAYAAAHTPHIFIINPSGELAYKGGIEKAPTSPSKVGQSEEQYLVPVLEALVQGQTPPHTDTRSIGCTIKRERQE